MPDSLGEDAPIVFRHDVESLKGFVHWFDAFEAAVLNRIGPGEFVLDVDELNRVLANGTLHLGCLNPVDAVRTRDMIRSLQADVAGLLVDYHRTAGNSGDFAARAEKIKSSINTNSVYLRYLGLCTRNVLSEIETRTKDDPAGKSKSAVTGSPEAAREDEGKSPKSKSKAGKTSINARMIDWLSKRPEAENWTVRQFATALNCSEGGVHKTETWKALQAQRNAKLNERRAEPGDWKSHEAERDEQLDGRSPGKK